MVTLVTGFPGWLGTRLVEILRAGLPEVPALAEPDRTLNLRCLVQPNIDLALIGNLDSVQFCRGDLTSPETLAPFCADAAGAILYHCAGIVHPTHGVREFFRVNVDGTRNLLQAAENAGVRRAVVVSSNSVFGNNPHRDHLFDETSPFNPYQSYGRSKMQLEQVVREFISHGKMEIVLVRPPWFYGPHQPPRQTTFFKMIKEGTFPMVGDGENRRSMGYVDNICQGLILCGGVPQAVGQSFWIADRAPYTMNEIVGTVERLMETEFAIPVSHKRFWLPSIVADVAGFADGILQRVGLYQQQIHVLSEMNKTIACSTTKAERELGYAPKIELEEGMRRSIAWLLAQGYKL